MQSHINIYTNIAFIIIAHHLFYSVAFLLPAWFEFSFTRQTDVAQTYRTAEQSISAHAHRVAHSFRAQLIFSSL